MSKNEEKFLSVDKFREKVYQNVGTLDNIDEIESGEAWKSAKPGCLGLLVIPFSKNLSSYSNRKMREHFKIAELEKIADEILADEEIKKLLCEKLDATINLPIDAAYKITPVLYGLALEDEEKVPFSTMLFAIISRKIVKQGVENYCPKQ
jgi:hypothetical protein